MKDFIVSFDDLYDGNDQWEQFLKLHDEIPELKVTFFVIASNLSYTFWKKINQPWCELVYHSDEHTGNWLTWSKEEAKDRLQFHQYFNFAKGFKAPGWKMTQNIADAINELGYWGCVCNGYEFGINKKWITERQGFLRTDSYFEMYGHTQDRDLHDKLYQIKEIAQTNEVQFKFISEVVK